MSMQFDDAFQLPFDDVSSLNGGEYDADGSFALGEIMQQKSFSQVNENLAVLEEPAPKGLVGTLYDSFKNSVDRQNDGDDTNNVPLQDTLQSGGGAKSGTGSMSGQMSGHMSMSHQSSTHFAPVFGFSTKTSACVSHGMMSSLFFVHSTIANESLLSIIEN